MSLVSFKSEAMAIVCLLRDFPYRDWLWGKVSPEHFIFSPWIKAYQGIIEVRKQRDHLPKDLEVEILTHFDNEVRDALDAFAWQQMPLPDYEGVVSIVDSLEHFRKKRILSYMAEHITNHVLQEEIGPDVISKAIYRIEDDILQLHFDPLNVTDHMKHIGVDDQTDYIKKLLSPDVQNVVPSGIEPLDNEMGGFPVGGLVLLAGNTKGGKSIMAQNVGEFAYATGGYDAALVGLELTQDQYTRRLLSSLSRIDSLNIMRGLLTPKQAENILRDWQVFERIGKVKGNRLTIYVPPVAVSMQDILSTMKPFRHRLLIIDQPSLLIRGRNEEDWLHLKNATMLAKRYAIANNCVIVLPVQVDEQTDRIRYSHAMKENCDLLIQWHYTPASIQKGYVNMKVTARDGSSALTFKLVPNFAHSRWETYHDTASNTASPEVQRKVDPGRLDVDMASTNHIPMVIPQQNIMTPSGLVVGQGGLDPMAGAGTWTPPRPLEKPNIFNPVHQSPLMGVEQFYTPILKRN